jgi:Rrf2 family protein
MISREADYGLRVIHFLTRHFTDKENISTAMLSAELDIPYHFLRQIAKKLKEKALIVSRKGKGGGLRLNRTPSEISLHDVIKALHPSAVYLNTCTENENNCERSGFCDICRALMNVQGSLDSGLKEITFDKI